MKRRYCYVYKEIKWYFENEEEAQKYIQQHQLLQRPYKCVSCLGWHITSLVASSKGQKQCEKKQHGTNEMEAQIKNDPFFEMLMKIKEQNNLE